jgi:hypothetical protein
MLKQLRNGYQKTKSLLGHRTNTRLMNTNDEQKEGD